MEYDLHSEFDIEKHKQRYVDYLEVLILEDGKVVYAVPSHQMKAEDLCCQKLGITRQQLSDMCPEEYYFDYMTWLLDICGAVSVWNDFYKTGKQGLNFKQRVRLQQLKLNGLYYGGIR